MRRAFFTPSDEIFLVQPITFVGARPQLFEGAKTIMGLVDHRGNPTHCLPTLPGEEELHLGMLEKGIFTRIEKSFAIEEKRGDLKVITPINPPQKCDKGFGIV